MKAASAISFTALVCSILGLFGAISSGHINRDLFFTSDELSLIVEMQDWLAGTPLTSITVSPAVFLPDYLIVFLLRTVAGGSPALIIYGFIFSLIVLFISGWLLLAREIGGKRENMSSFVLAVSALVLLCVSYYPNPFRVIIHPAFHTTAFAALPFGLWLVLRSLFRESRSLIPILAVLFLLPLFVSDRIFLAWFTVPALATVGIWAALRRGNIQNKLKTSLILTAGASALFIFTKVYPGIAPAEIIETHGTLSFWSLVRSAMSAFFLWWLPKMAEMFRWLLVVWFAWMFVTVGLIRNGLNTKAETALIFLFFTVVFQIAAVIFTGRFAYVSGVAEAHFQIRYMLPSVFIPLFFGWILPFAVWGNKRAKSVLTTVLCGVVAVLSIPRIAEPGGKPFAILP